MIRECIALVMLGGLAACGSERPTAPATAVVEWLTLAYVGGDRQTGVVGTKLETPIRVRVLGNGTPRSGVQLSWSSPDGKVVASGVSDGAGIIAAEWTLGTAAGPKTARAFVLTAGGAQLADVFFSATAVAGPPSSIQKVAGDRSTLVANNCRSLPPAMAALARDRYSNPVLARAISWEIVSGPIALAAPPTLNLATGTSYLSYRVTGEPGVGRVRAWLSAEAGPAIEFTVTVTPRRYEIFFMDFYGDDMEFQSQQQCNTYGGPPIDTVPLGDTVRWVNKRYYETFQVLSVGEPSFPSSGAIKLDDSYSLVFTTPGTYRYVEAGDPTIGGTIVVR